MNHRTTSFRTRTGLRAVAAALTLTLASGAMAQGLPGYGHDHDPGPRRVYEHTQRDYDRHGHYGRYGGASRPFYSAHPSMPRPYADWRRGGYIPATYSAPQYVVNDWRARRLQAPPSGYQWMQVNGDFVLGAIAGGLIAAIVAGQ